MTQQINSIALTSLTLPLHNDFHNQVNNLIVAIGAEALHIEEQAAQYAALVVQENSIVKRQTSYVSTTQLKEADQKRDHALGVVMNIIVAHRTNTIEAKRTAALALDAMVAPYKGIGSHEYRTESREVAGLIAVLGTTAAKMHVATLALTQELSALEEANTAFDIVMSSKQMEEAARSPQTTLSTDQLRAQLDQAYAAIVQIVNAYAVIQSSTQIENFITQVNALVTLVKRSAAKPAAKEEESGDDTGENKEQGGDVNGDVSGEA